MDIDDANRHPTLGLIEPCIDEFEIWTDDPEPRNIALQREGTRVTASGSRESAIHQLKHLHDGMYGNSHSWMSDQAGKGWVLFELPRPTRIGRIVWGRDREGQFQDRLATAYRISAGLEPDALEMVASKATLRTSVHPKRNTDRIPPTRAKQVRFTILETNRLEPCIDELEVITSEGVNVALESHGSIATSAGDKVDPGRHELRFVNDGQYGNSSSWMSSEVGKGAVTITLPRVETIERIVWGRDRQGQFTDRLATQYRIEIADEDPLQSRCKTRCIAWALGVWFNSRRGSLGRIVAAGTKTVGIGAEWHPRIAQGFRGDLSDTRRHPSAASRRSRTTQRCSSTQSAIVLRSCEFGRG